MVHTSRFHGYIQHRAPPINTPLLRTHHSPAPVIVLRVSLESREIAAPVMTGRAWGARCECGAPPIGGVECVRACTFPFPFPRPPTGVARPERDALGGASPSVCLVNDAGLPTVCALVWVCAPCADGEGASAKTDTLGGADADSASARGAWMDAERDELSSGMGAGAWMDAASPSARRKSSSGSLLGGAGLGATLCGGGEVSLGGVGAVSC